jgi:SLT domain-containing protein
MSKKEKKEGLGMIIDDIDQALDYIEATYKQTDNIEEQAMGICALRCLKRARKYILKIGE